jgi:hypothetical protein
VPAQRHCGWGSRPGSTACMRRLYSATHLRRSRVRSPVNRTDRVACGCVQVSGARAKAPGGGGARQHRQWRRMSSTSRPSPAADGHPSSTTGGDFRRPPVVSGAPARSTTSSWTSPEGSPRPLSPFYTGVAGSHAGNAPHTARRCVDPLFVPMRAGGEQFPTYSDAWFGPSVRGFTLTPVVLFVQMRQRQHRGHQHDPDRPGAAEHRPAPQTWALYPPGVGW